MRYFRRDRLPRRGTRCCTRRHFLVGTLVTVLSSVFVFSLLFLTSLPRHNSMARRGDGWRAANSVALVAGIDSGVRRDSHLPNSNPIDRFSKNSSVSVVVNHSVVFDQTEFFGLESGKEDNASAAAADPNNCLRTARDRHTARRQWMRNDGTSNGGMMTREVHTFYAKQALSTNIVRQLGAYSAKVEKKRRALDASLSASSTGRPVPQLLHPWTPLLAELSSTSSQKEISTKNSKSQDTRCAEYQPECFVFLNKRLDQSSPAAPMKDQERWSFLKKKCCFEHNVLQWAFTMALLLARRARLEVAPTAGTLLGYVREGALIPWDTDVDLLVPAKGPKDASIVAAVHRLLLGDDVDHSSPLVEKRHERGANVEAPSVRVTPTMLRWLDLLHGRGVAAAVLQEAFRGFSSTVVKGCRRFIAAAVTKRGIVDIGKKVTDAEREAILKAAARVARLLPPTDETSAMSPPSSPMTLEGLWEPSPLIALRIPSGHVRAPTCVAVRLKRTTDHGTIAGMIYCGAASPSPTSSSAGPSKDQEQEEVTMVGGDMFDGYWHADAPHVELWARRDDRKSQQAALILPTRPCPFLPPLDGSLLPTRLGAHPLLSSLHKNLQAILSQSFSSAEPVSSAALSILSETLRCPRSIPGALLAGYGDQWCDACKHKSSNCKGKHGSY